VALAAVALMLLATGCATPTATSPPPAADISGEWAGVWIGYGIEDISRREPAFAELRQRGSYGHGRLVLENTGAAEAVPKALRLPGLTGAPVNVFVSGKDVILAHDLDEWIFAVDMVVDGDHMTGTVRDSYPPVRLVLDRVRPPAPPGRSEAPVAPRAPATASAPPSPQAPAVVPTAPPTPSERPAPTAFSGVAGLRPIHFDFDRSDIRAGDAAILDANTEWLKSNRGTDLLVEGHCDERGTNEYNLALGERRARAARDYLVAHGIEATRITVLSYGEDRPVCQEHTEACWEQNRRAEFRAKAR
jgi:peptidoglycan-associated lipoprotein